MALWSLKDHSFLIIDDFAEIRTVLHGMLIPLGASDVAHARNGEAAIAALRAGIFDAAFSAGADDASEPASEAAFAPSWGPTPTK